MSESHSNLPAVRLDTSVELIDANTDSWTAVLAPVVELARSISGTDFVPASLRNNIAGTTAAILYAREIGLPPMVGLGSTHVIKGKPAIYAETMRAMVLSKGHRLEVRRTDHGSCTLAGQRKDSDHWTEVTYTIDDARTAGLLGNDNYKKNPRRMLQARATTELCALVFPDVIRGMSSVEELWDEGDDDAGTRGPASPAPAESRTTVRRKASQRRTKGDDGAEAPAGGPPPAAGPAEPAPSSPLMPPLPGEPGATVDRSGGSNRAPHPGSTDGARRDDPGSGPNVPDSDGDEAAGGAPADSGTDRVEPAEAPAGEETPPADPVEDEDRPRMAHRGMQKAMFAAFGSLDIKDDAARYYAMSKLIGRDVTSSNELTVAEATTVLDTLAKVETREQLLAVIAAAENTTENQDGDPNE